ncbi:hypothetical protein LC040_12110 [Bacillus tianshenii]|nr:hypothetical protein LC040_12110 [Bacillus tianshenii]
MRLIHPDLLQYLSSQFQISGRAPNQAVFLFNKNTNEQMRLDRVMSIDVDQRWDTPAGEFRIVADNQDGWLSPDYAEWKIDDLSRMDRGQPSHNPWSDAWPGVIWPNTKVEIWLGYGTENDLLKQITGLVDTVAMNAEMQTITITGRTMYKKVLVETPNITGESYKYTNTTARDILIDIHSRIGLSISASPILIHGTNSIYDVKEFEIKRGRTWDSYVSDLILSTYTRIHSNSDGVTIVEPVPQYSQSSQADHVLDETINLQSLSYRIDDIDIFSNVLVKSENGMNAYVNSFFRDHVMNGQFREEVLDIPWADTEAKRQMAAAAFFRRMRQKFRSISVASVGHPGIELYDLCRVKEIVSTASAKYVVKGIRTSYSEQGYFDFLELEFT